MEQFLPKEMFAPCSWFGMMTCLCISENLDSLEVHILSGGSKLQITRSQLLDSGTYTCLASNPEGKAQKTYVLSIQGKEWRRMQVAQLVEHWVNVTLSVLGTLRSQPCRKVENLDCYFCNQRGEWLENSMLLVQNLHGKEYPSALTVELEQSYACVCLLLVTSFLLLSTGAALVGCGSAHRDGFRSSGTCCAVAGVSKDLLPEFP